MREKTLESSELELQTRSGVLGRPGRATESTAVFQTQGTTTDGTKVKGNDKSVGSAAEYRAEAVDEELKDFVRGGEDDVNRLGWCSIQ